LKHSLESLKKRILEYQDKLDKFGLKDYQIPTLHFNLFKLLYTVGHLVIVLTLSSLPSLFLNAPVGIIARKIAENHQKEALAGSRVKIEAKDVLLSKKILLSIVLVPSLWIIYGILLITCTNFSRSAIILCFWCMPLFSLFGVRATESGMMDYKDLKPVLQQIWPSNRRVIKNLPKERALLQSELRAVIKEIGPSLGGLYTNKDLDWGHYMKRTGSISSLAEMASINLVKSPRSPSDPLSRSQEINMSMDKKSSKFHFDDAEEKLKKEN